MKQPTLIISVMKSIMIIIMITGAQLIQGQQQIPYETYFMGPHPENAQSKKLIFIDFWASWCIPCVKAMPQIEYQQELLGDKVYFASMSAESEYVINKFLKKHQFETSVFKDFERVNHERFNVHALPYSVLMNRKGEIVWEGHPADLKTSEFKKLVRNVSTSGEGITFAKTEKTQTLNNDTYQKKEVGNLFKKYEIEYFFPDNPISERVRSNEEHFIFNGRITVFLSRILEVPESQIQAGKYSTKYLKIKVPPELLSEDKKSLLTFLSSELSMKIEKSKSLDSTLVLIYTSETNLLDDSTINYGEGVSLLSDSEIEADEISSKEFVGLMSKVLEYPVMMENAPIGKYDWKLHIKYENLMNEQLINEYKFDIERKNISQTIYTLIPKS